MFNVKHFLEPVDEADGRRIWVEPIGLTKDLCEWQQVTQQLTPMAPPRELCQWFEEHPGEYDQFRGRYHDWLAAGPHLTALHQLAKAARRETITLLHQGDDPQHNSATALYEFLSELEAHIPDAD